MAERTHESVVRYVEGLLTRGELAPGDRLPAERVLAERLSVGRPSVREGLKVLAALGVVQASPCQGRGSAALVVARPGAAMGAALRLHVETASLPIHDLVDTRVLLETASVRALAMRVRREGDGVLARPRELLAVMAAPGLAAADFHTLDTAFHVALAEAAGNAVVTAIMAALREAVEGYVVRVVATLPDWDVAAAGLRADHQAVLDAVASSDAAAAAELVEGHIRGFLLVRADGPPVPRGVTA